MKTHRLLCHLRSHAESEPAPIAVINTAFSFSHIFFAYGRSKKKCLAKLLQFCNDCVFLQEVSRRGDSAAAMKWIGRSSVERAAAALFVQLVQRL